MGKIWAETQENLSYCNLYKMNGEKSCKLCMNFECKHNSKLDRDKQIEVLWMKLEDIPMDENNQLDCDYFIWKKGTDKITIWEWFDIFHSKGIVWLMNEFEK